MTEDHHAGPFAQARWFGAPVRRREDPRLITGAGTYIDDITLPGMLQLVFVRSPHAHARVRSVDATAARAMPGVVAVVTCIEGEEWLPDFPPNAGYKQPPRFVLARGVVRKVGEAVAAVVAETRYQAADAAEAVLVEYEPLPAVTDAEAAIAPDAPQLWEDFPGNAIVLEQPHGSGDLDAALAEAEVVIQQKMTCARLAPSAIETRGAVADYRPWERSLTAWITTQSPHGERSYLARMLGLAEGNVRVIAPEVGGGFGAKGNIYHEEIMVALLAMRLGRPVKWIETRSESFHGTAHGRGQLGYLTLAAKRDGTLLGLDVRVVADLGHACDISTAGLFGNTVRLAPNTYHLPAARVTLTEAITNKTPTGAYRGAGRPEAIYYTERMMDLLARELDMDPVELRRKNLIQPDQFPHATVTGVVYDSGDYGLALDTVLQMADYEALKRERDDARAAGRLVGIGVALFVENAGPPALNEGGGPVAWEYGAVRVDASGAVEVTTGVSAHGQGHETTFAQLAAEVLGVPLEAVTLHERDTAVAPQGVGTFGSRSMIMGGSAVYLSLRQVEAKLRRMAAALIEANEDDLVFRDGRIEPVDAPSRGLPFAQVAARAYAAPPAGEGPGLAAEQFYASAGSTFPFGAYLALVEVDRDTGETTILKFFGVDDCGPVVNPLIVAGQVHGGIAQGVGQALLEEVVYDESGQLLSGTFMDYALPTAETMPALTIGHTVTPTPRNPLGLKGVGESGTIGSTPTIANAVMDALAPLGIRHLDIPLTPLKVWTAINEAVGNRQ